MGLVDAIGQPIQSNLKKKKIAANGIVQIDSLSLVPNTFNMVGVDSSYFFIDPINGTLKWLKPFNRDSVEVSYRTFPYRLNAVAKRFTYDSVMNNFIAQPFVFNRNNQTATSGNVFDFGGINYNGSFGRALSFGNNQDVVVNSQFNLQLNGFIGDSIEIAAAITDNNIPIQPDGTTQQLNEFDRVWLQFKKKGWELNLGDIDLRQNQAYFLNFYKRLQGISYTTQNKISKSAHAKSTIAGAIAKGKFTRNIFQGQEGNQGPYRLRGANNELFFIVLANTERVFIDGELLQRGEDQDYVINYNTAEISFTPRRMITKDKRIQVEFEYADRNYLNSLLYVNNQTTINKQLDVFVAAYSNADAKNSPINQSLDDKQKQFLNQLGDSIQNAFFPVASLDTFSTGKILYAKRFVIFPGGSDSIYVYSTHPDSAKYSLGFIEVGEGRGNYIPFFNGANGKVFQWIAPIGGKPQGNYEPAAYLVTPKKQQLITSGFTYRPNDKTNVKAEVALSNYNVNAFSTKDKSNDNGIAAKISFDHTTTLPTKKKLQLATTLGYEIVDRKFKALERLRTVEFYRDWGLDFLPEAATENLPTVQLELSDDSKNSIAYQFAGYIRSDDFNGSRHTITHQQNIKGWQLKNVFNLSSVTNKNNKGFFLRPTIDISKQLKQWNNYTIGANYQLEHNEQQYTVTDTITPNSFSFENISAYVKSNQAKNNRWAFTWFTRSDKLPLGKALVATDRSQNYNLQIELLENRKHQLRINTTYRALKVFKAISNQKADNSLLGRVEYTINEWKGLLTGNVLYELGAGQEQRRDFSYIEVPAGRGEYAWNDYNADGIPQLNEFEIALYPDQAKYIRVYTPTNEFIKANYNQFNYSLTLNPRAMATSINNKKFRNIITRFNVQSSYQTGKKVLADGKPEFNPFKGGIADTALIALNNIITNTLSFNRFSSQWGIDITNAINFNKAILTYGFESRQLNDWLVRGRWNITRQFTFELLQKLSNNQLTTPSFANRNYQIESVITEPKLSYIKGTTWRLTSGYQYNQKANSVALGGEKATAHSINIEMKYNAVNNTSINGKFTFSNITYNGLANSTISYIMLDALLPGKNYLWNIDFTKRLGNNLELNFQYEGRKPGETRTIHIGRASLRALL
jgi:hypothetical protein